MLLMELLVLYLSLFINIPVPFYGITEEPKNDAVAGDFSGEAFDFKIVTTPGSDNYRDKHLVLGKLGASEISVSDFYYQLPKWDHEQEQFNFFWAPPFFVKLKHKLTVFYVG